MKRLVLYLFIISGLLFAPVERANVGELEPIQAVWISSRDGFVVLQTDTEDQGTGETVTKALQDMKLHSQGIVYLDTAQFLLVSEGAEGYIRDISQYLKGSVKVCLWDGQGSVADAARYMQAHKTGVRLSRWDDSVKLPELPL